MYQLIVTEIMVLRRATFLAIAVHVFLTISEMIMNAKPVSCWSSIVKYLKSAVPWSFAAFAVSLITLFPLPVRAQPTVEWQAVFGGTNYDECNVVLEADGGGYILAGDSLSSPSGNKTNVLDFDAYDCWLIKTDPGGNKLWEQVFGGDGNDRLYTMIKTADGGYLFGGLSTSSEGSGNKSAPRRNGSGITDFWIVKTDANGNRLWDQSYGGTSSDTLSCILPTADDGYLLGGYSASTTNGTVSNKTADLIGGYDFWVIKTDTNGVILWQQTYGGTNNDFLYTMLPTGDGGFLLGGESTSPASGNKTNESIGLYDYWLVRIDENGNKLWDRCYGGIDQDWMLSIQPTMDGGYILAGTSASDNFGGPPVNRTAPSFDYEDYWVVNVDANGNPLWDEAFGGNDSDYLSVILPTSDGGFLAGGFSYSPSSGNKTGTNYGPNSLEDYWIVKMDADGYKQWDQVFGGTDWDDLYNMLATSDGGFMLCGSSQAPMSGNKTVGDFGEGDYWVIKLASDMMPEPLLTISRAAADVMLTWPLPSTGFELEQNSDLTTTNWTGVNSPVVDDGTNKITYVPIGSGKAYFRLKHP